MQVETPEVPAARTQFYERQAVAWLQAEAEFNSRTWPFLIVSDVSQWARTWLPAGLVDASPAELEAAYVRGEIPYIPFDGLRLERGIDVDNESSLRRAARPSQPYLLRPKTRGR